MARRRERLSRAPIVWLVHLGKRALHQFSEALRARTRRAELRTNVLVATALASLLAACASWADRLCRGADVVLRGISRPRPRHRKRRGSIDLQVCMRRSTFVSPAGPPSLRPSRAAVFLRRLCGASKSRQVALLQSYARVGGERDANEDDRGQRTFRKASDKALCGSAKPSGCSACDRRCRPFLARGHPGRCADTRTR